MGREKREKPGRRGSLKNNGRREHDGAARLDKGIETEQSQRQETRDKDSDDLQQTPEQKEKEKRANKSLNSIS